MKTVLLFSVLLIAGCSACSQWQKIDDGMEFASFKLNMPTSGDSLLEIIRLDPELFDFELLLASEHGNQTRSISKWADGFQLAAAINAGMFQVDHLTSTGFLVNYHHKNNAQRHSSYNMYFVCNPRQPDLPEAQIVDWQQPDAKELVDMYHSALQCIRMVAAGGRNVWSQQNVKWNEAALGQDSDGNILFIFCASPYTMHDLVNQLLDLPLDLDKMMHLEGGPEASLYINNNDFKLRRIGSSETGFIENSLNSSFWKIPNIIGIKKK
jgi:hypothetical protein